MSAFIKKNPSIFWCVLLAVSGVLFGIQPAIAQTCLTRYGDSTNPVQVIFVNGIQNSIDEACQASKALYDYGLTGKNRSKASNFFIYNPSAGMYSSTSIFDFDAPYWVKKTRVSLVSYLKDSKEVFEQASNSDRAIKAGKSDFVNGLGSVSDRYQFRLGEIYSDAFANNKHMDAATIGIYSPVFRVADSVLRRLQNGKKVILVAHSQGNLVVEAAYAYLYYKGNQSLLKNLRIVGVAPASYSSPPANARYIRLVQDEVIGALSGISTVVFAFGSDFYPLPGNEQADATIDALWIKDAVIHGFIPIYLSDGIATLSGKTMRQIINEYIQGAFNELLPPTAVVTVGTTSAVVGQTVSFDGSSSSTVMGASIANYLWNFGDGLSSLPSSSPTTSHTYLSAGTYAVSLTVTDDVGGTNTATRTVVVTPPIPVGATGLLNDTGIDWCSENVTTGSWRNNIACDSIAWGANLWGTAQDAYSGRDAQAKAGTLTKVGSGMAGFDYTRLGADGQPLTIQNGTYSPTGSEVAGTRWDCVRDNVTGLIWEVKRMDSATNLRYYTHTYSWYNPDTTTNGGTVGFETGGTCSGLAKCNTHAYKTAVNALPSGQAVCGSNDWRVPNIDELKTLVNLGRFSPAIDTNHFPDQGTGPITWSSSPHAYYIDYGWNLLFSDGVVSYEPRGVGNAVRLVRSGQ